jgi:hypothetical protein
LVKAVLTMPNVKKILAIASVYALIVVAVALIANAMVVFVIALLTVVLRLIYIKRFGYRSSLDQPLKYRTVRKAFTVASVISVWVAVVALVADGSIILPIVFVLGCFAAGHVVRFRNYLRAVMYHSEMKDSTGAYVFTGSPQERDKTARLLVDADIDSGRLI